MLAKASRLFEVDEVSALDSFIFRVMHPAPSLNHSLRMGRYFPLFNAIGLGSRVAGSVGGG
jgi:hypothetical protein